MKRFLQELDLKQRDYVGRCDSQNVIDLSKNSLYHARTKHKDVRYHWIKKAIEEQLFQIRKTHTYENTTDMMVNVIIKEKTSTMYQEHGHELLLRSQEDSHLHLFVAWV